MRLLLLFLLGTLILPSPAFALGSEWQKDGEVAVRLISGVEGVGALTSVPLGLEVMLAPNWHTYWRSPGEAGFPPQIEWQNSLTEAGNVQRVDLLYPAPKRYEALGLETIGYRDHVVFPLEARVLLAGRALNLEATVSLLVCSAICVPKSFVLKMTVPVGEAAEGAEASLLRQFQDQIPGTAGKSGLLLQSLINDGQSLTFRVESRDDLSAPDIFIEDDAKISFAAPVTVIAKDRHSVLFTVKPADSLPEGGSLAGMKLVVTVVDKDHAMEQAVTAPPVSRAPPSSVPPPLPLAVAILFALVGGFILNLMPCVLPVLSLKILSLIGHGGGKDRVVRHSFLNTAAGIVFSYLVLAGMTILLKEFGLSLGWGVQFQQPVFLIGLILLLVFFAANMWGLFEVPLPRFIANRAEKAAYHPKLAGDFATGAFATLLATPCSAPFLGTAVGFALASGPLQILIIFASLGVGMALPYVAIACFPRIATCLPKPGLWMVYLRNLLGGALAGTALWLTWVLTAQISGRYAILVGLCMMGIIVLLGLRKTTVSKRFIKFGILEFVFLAIGLVVTGAVLPKSVPEVDPLWLPFGEQAIRADIAEGKTVFVDVTADWCLTCKANKRFILSQDELSQKLFHSGLITMQANWTNPDPVITAFLQKYGRYGIPFNIVFGPKAPEGIVLPEILSLQVVTDALDRASK